MDHGRKRLEPRMLGHAEHRDVIRVHGERRPVPRHRPSDERCRDRAPLYGKVLSCGKPLMAPVGDAIPEYVATEPGKVWSSSAGCGGSESPRSAGEEPRAARNPRLGGSHSHMAVYGAYSACTGARVSADTADADGPMIAPHSMHVAIIFPAFTAAP